MLDGGDDDDNADEGGEMRKYLGGRENWSGLMQPPLIGNGCSIPGTRPARRFFNTGKTRISAAIKY